MSDSRVLLPIAISLGVLASGAWAGPRGHSPADMDRDLLEVTVRVRPKSPLTSLAASGVLFSLPAAAQRAITGREFFPHLISGSFHQGLVVVFAVAAALSALAAFASLLRGGRYVDDGDENRDL